MAEVESRNNYPGGYGGGRGHFGGGGNRKRRFREDDDYDRRSVRRRYDEIPPSARIRKEILSIAESPLHKPEDDAAAIGRRIAEHSSDDIFCNHTFEFIPQLIVEQPFKIPFIAAIVRHVNLHKPELANRFMEKIADRTQASLDKGQWRSLKLLLRFLGCLQPLFEDDGVFSLLDELFNRAVDLQAASSEDALGLELAKIIMLTIPYSLTILNANLELKAAELLEKTGVIASAPHPFGSLVNPYDVTETRNGPGSPSVISLLHAQLQAEATKGWPLLCIPRPFVMALPSENSGEPEEAVTIHKHKFPSIIVASTLNSGPAPLFPEVYFSVFADQDIETVPKTSEIAATLLRDNLVDTINILDFNRAASAKFLIEMDCYWAADTFVKRATPVDRLKDVSEGKSTWKTEDLAVDAIFSQMLQLPNAEHKLVYYHSMVTETCKIAPAAVAPSLGRAIRFLYSNLSTMDQELTYRFMDWFSHHLSNFDFRWKWVEWVNDVDISPLHPRKSFILGVTDKEVRLSFAKRIRETLPERYHPLIPASKDNDIPEYKYNRETTPYSKEAKSLLQHIKRKSPDSDIAPIITAINDSELDRTNGTDDGLVMSTDAFVTTLCYIGSKSLSHVLSYIERHKERLLSIGPASDAARMQIIDSVVAYWREVQPGVAVNIIDKLLNYTIVTPASVLEWALAPEQLQAGSLLAETWVYEMVSGTMGKVTNRMRQIVRARNQTSLPPSQVEALDETLLKEREGMRALFATIADAVKGVAEGSNNAMVEGQDGQGEGKEMELLQLWGGKWARVFARKAAVEESVVSEAMKSFPAAGPETSDEVVMVDPERSKKDGAADQQEDLIDLNGGDAVEDEIL
ncbi:MAG: hypothetical protein M1828_002870 [Chrysothrix sp. TS-e1954]|nr:MAG: hypothetical protein M1828_002870 [Chrysothrix sp. TS-e1954]